MLRAAIVCSSFTLLLISCGKDKEGAPVPGDKKKIDPANNVGQVAPPAPRPTDTQSRPGYVPPIAEEGTDPSFRADTSNGTLTVQGNGAVDGSWKFYDVNAVMEERAGGGMTTGLFQLEGHRVGPNANLVIRIFRDNGEITPGSYGFQTPGSDTRLDVSWDLDGEFYKGIGGGSGTVIVKSIEGDRAVGSFDLTLPPFNREGKPQTVKGTFDQKIMK